MTDKALLIMALVAVVIVQIINAVRMESAMKDINEKIDDINVRIDQTAKHTARVVELAAENSARWGYVNTVAHDVHGDVKDLHIRMINIIKRYINYKGPVAEEEEEREEEEDD